MFDFSTIHWRGTSYEGIFLHFLRRDEETGDSTVLIRMEPGCGYPAHRHEGIEEVLILQGGYSDKEGEHRAGDYVLNEAGSTHYPIALDGAEACIMIAFAHGGIKLLGKD
jgi:anti-sigma factor ChrR (cupin superfamily)